MQDGIIVMSTAEKLIWKELQIQRSMLQSLIDKQVEYSLEEISVNKAARILKRGYEFVISEITSGNLPARHYKVNGVIRYRIKMSSLQDYIKATKVIHVKTKPSESSEETFLKLRKNIIGV